MDRLDQNENSKSLLNTKTEYIEEKLDTTPFWDKNIVWAKMIKIGNTGFDLLIDEKTKITTFDFEPENRMASVEEKYAKDASLLCLSLLKLHELLNDNKKLSEFKIDLSRMPTIGASTNDQMIDAMEELFSKSDTNNILSIDRPLIDVDTQKFKNLNDNDPLIGYLRRVSKRTVGTMIGQTYSSVK